ncbi:MAG: cytochrome b/b6 domain-containing protein [Steroidobacteraceae bacterium]|jgi:cytochrome b|nr:cytochrome b/b6 domain-containing protein [Steroidobacteraceae bacterium]
MSGAAVNERPTLRVWDPLVRIGHWSLAACVLLAWLTRHEPGRWHEWLGYGALTIVGVRFVWGWIGSRHARFADFVRSPGETLEYAEQALHGAEPRVVGHNPLGGWMIVALLATVACVGLSGWLYTTDRYWGVEWVERLHGASADVLLVLIGLHVTGVLYASWRHRENLIASMVHGRKKP